MAIIKDITIVNETKLRLDTDASKGDIIDLASLNEVDTSLIVEKINQARDEEYNKKLLEHEKRLQAESEARVLNATSKLNEEITKLNTELENIASKTESKLKLEHQKEFSLLNEKLLEEQHKLKTLEDSLEKEIGSAVLKKETELNSRIKDLEHLIREKDTEVKTIKETSEKDKSLALKEREAELKETINELQLEVNNLRLQKSSLGVKVLGETLEGWCNNEYINAAVNGFETCTWDKDNLIVRKPGETTGTKADYIFRVYANEEKKEEDLLTSVILEMKSESPTTKNKRKNKDFYEKLDKDRRKKNAEYALLISELEWEQDNDVPIRRIQEYDKMYLVRPQYFINFLGIIASLALKYKEILVESNRESLKFKDIKDILDEFEKMKDDILDKTLLRLEKDIIKINDNADLIIKYTREIKISAEKIIDRTLKTIKNKINNFNIRKINKQIEKIEEFVEA